MNCVSATSSSLVAGASHLRNYHADPGSTGVSPVGEAVSASQASFSETLKPTPETGVLPGTDPLREPKHLVSTCAFALRVANFAGKHPIDEPDQFRVPWRDRQASRICQCLPWRFCGDVPRNFAAIAKRPTACRMGGRLRRSGFCLIHDFGHRRHPGGAGTKPGCTPKFCHP